MATNNIPKVQHVIIVIQENRTPTNLFQQDGPLITTGAHIVSSLPVADLCGNPEGFLLQDASLFTCYDPNHNHTNPHPDWTKMWNSGYMNGACDVTVKWSNQNPAWCPPPGPQCLTNGNGGTSTCPYTFVENSPNPCPGYGCGYDILDPYFNVAKYYGYANYMFQTNQGPSFPAHQFLLSGSSAPDQINDSNDDTCSPYCHYWFAAENGADNNNWGCLATSDNLWEINPSFDEYQGIYNNGIPCYNRPTLVGLLDGAGLSWKYYARSATGLWTTPNAIQDICQPYVTIDGTNDCGSQDWLNNVQAALPTYNPSKNTGDAAPFLTDIGNCNLPAVSWVVPDGNWSDHAGGPTNEIGDGGPSWVAAIVNAIGQSYANSNGQCDYWGYPAHTGTTPQPTVILITWDDWGGYYDDVVPPDCKTYPCTGYSNQTGQQYVCGFRVPLLVVGAYAIPGHISGAFVSPQNLNCALPPLTTTATTSAAS